jgi:UDP-glucose 6-dehydrogenase
LSIFNPDIVFICVPTPMGENGNQDSTIIKNVAKELVECCPSSLKVIKSTVLPSILEILHKFDKRLIYNPEFLREKDVNAEWNLVTNIISQDKRIGDSHMSVPGHDGKRGFGGACFPKDSSALAKYAETLEVELTVLKAAINTNNKIRSEYSVLDDREIEQNISYNDKI